MWFYLGLLIGVGLVLLTFWLRSRGVNIAWYEWLIAAVGLALVSYGIQNYAAASAAGESTAPGVFLLVFGLPGVLLLAVAASLVWWGYARSHRAEKLSAA